MSHSAPRYLSDMSWKSAAGALRAHPIGLLPIGAIEAHGPHLPLDTDVIIARATAESAATMLQEMEVPAIILPEIAYTVSFAGLPFAGTTPVASDVFQAYATDVLNYHARQGYRAIVCCNAHLEPAHVDALQAACRQAGRRHEVPVLFPDQRTPEFSQHLGEEFQAGSRHAGAYETSIVLATKPQAVRTDVMRDLEPVWIDLPDKMRSGARTFKDAGAAEAYFGNPAGSSEEMGRALLQALGEMIVSSCKSAGVLSK